MDVLAEDVTRPERHASGLIFVTPSAAYPKSLSTVPARPLLASNEPERDT
jgi:hypothetical protein